MNRIIAFFLLSQMSLVAFAQQVEYPCDGYIAKGKYEKAQEKIFQAINKEPDATVFYAAAMLHATKSYVNFDPDKAYDYMLKSQDCYAKADEKRRLKLEKHGYNVDMYANAYIELAKLGLEQADNNPSVENYDKFLNLYARASANQKYEATNKRNAIAFAQTQQQNSVAAYDAFLKKYPQAKEVKQATKERNALAYKEADNVGTLAAYNDFLSKYPNANEAPKAWEHIFQIAYNDTQRLNTEQGYWNYAQQYPQSQYAVIATAKAKEMQYVRLTANADWEAYQNYFKEYPENKVQRIKAQSAMCQLVKKSRNVSNLDYCIESFDTAFRDSCLLVLHDVYASTGDISDLRRFYDSYDLTNSCEQLRKLKMNDLALANIYQFGTTDEFICAAAPYYAAFLQLRELVVEDLKTKSWAKAAATVKKFADCFGSDHNYMNLLSVLEAPADKAVKVNSFGANINTKGEEYCSAMSGDGKTMLFCGKDRKDNMGLEDIFISTKRNGVWTKAKLIPDLNTPYGNEAPEALSADGTKLILFKDGNQYVSEKTAKGWSSPKSLSSNINISSWQADAMITSDGRAILFTSRNCSPHELSTSQNIYVSLLDENGEWGTPVDLGPTINTPFCDRSPILHPDMKTLYFCSEGHGAIGGLDVFKSTRLRDDSWTEWSEPVSLGKEINTIDNECWYKISTDGKTAYFSKTLNDNQDIFWLNLPEKMRPNPVATVSGRLSDPHGKPVTAVIKWEDLEQHKIIGQSQTDPEDGSFFIILPMGRNYGYYIDDEQFFPLSSNLDLSKKNENVVIENNLNIATIQQMIDEKIPMPLNNLFFNTGDSTLLATSVDELRRVANLIQKTGRKVEIGGHTDNTGDKVRNQLLSEARAMAAKSFLVEMGCDADKIITVGYGDSQNVADNKTTEGRRKNRRVEIRFVED
ncbi:MAG: OmpA family protein [Bacteroidales bacterium]|nr:OmpA family protein [Bacteroidales bacterium]MDY4174145.1 OmpA family protein [Bacteroidales bacterium]